MVIVLLIILLIIFAIYQLLLYMHMYMIVVWADNADMCSKQYAGTGALKTDFTRYHVYNVNDMTIIIYCTTLCYRTGSRSYGGMLRDGYNSAIRYFYNNFYDGFRQVRRHRIKFTLFNFAHYYYYPRRAWAATGIVVCQSVCLFVWYFQSAHLAAIALRLQHG